MKDKQWLRDQVNTLYRQVVMGELTFDEQWILRHVFDLVDQLDEPEMLSQEWIDEHLTDGHNVDAGDAVVFVDDLKKVAVTKQDKPVIPEFVADWYEREGKRSSWWNWFYKWGRDESRSDLETKTIKWMQDYNEEKFVDVFSRGYEVEKEPLYYIEIIDNGYVMQYPKSGNLSVTGYKKSSEGITQFTEREIKSLSEDYWPFAVPVEEVSQ